MSLVNYFGVYGDLHICVYIRQTISCVLQVFITLYMIVCACVCACMRVRVCMKVFLVGTTLNKCWRNVLFIRSVSSYYRVLLLLLMLSYFDVSFYCHIRIYSNVTGFAQVHENLESPGI